MDNKTIPNSDLWNYYFYPPQYLLGIAAITGAGHCRQSHSSRVVNRRYPDHTFVISCSDGGSLDFRGRHYELGRGDCFFIPEMELHTYGTNEGRIWESYWVSFKACGEIVQIWEKLLPPLQNIKDGTLLGCAMRIRELYMQNAAPELYTAALFTIMSILRRPQEPESMLKTDTVIENIHNYIIENIDKDLSLDEIAEKSGYSTTHLARLFKKRYGMAVNDYIINRRIANAQMLLAATQLSIKDISLKVGIADPLYFSRIFRKKLRICPSDFRRFYRGQ